jgi:serine/threonine-protein kinase HipA
MMNVKKIFVSIKLGKDEFEVGELVSQGKRIYFKYYSSFINKGFEISPFKMKLSEEILSSNEVPFEGLFGVFADSQPDGWGRLLLDRALMSRGVSLFEISSLDRLSCVGNKGMGALIYRPEFESVYEEERVLELDLIAQSVNEVLEGASIDLIEELYNLGGSSGGARPKILVGYNSSTNHLIHGVEDLPEGYEHWIIKFPSSSDRKDISNIEFAYYKMALAAGIEMNESKLFEGKSGNVYFGTKRFDRIKNERLHLHSAAGLMHDNFRLSNIDYGHIMDCAFKLENHVDAYEKILRFAAFNVFSNNRDDHSKNFSFLMDQYGKWKVSPAYDLTFSSSSHGMHSTMVSGESNNPGTKNLMELATYFQVKNAKEILERVQSTTMNWKKFGSENGVSKESIELIDKCLKIKK